MKYLATDLDKTLIPNGNAPYDKTLELLFEVINTNNFGLIYVTGRSLSSVIELINIYKLMKPSFIISQVGTKIYSLKNEPIEIKIWNQSIKDNNPNWSYTRIKNILSNNLKIELQNFSEQNEYKISYFIRNYNNANQISNEVQSQLKEKGIKSQIVLHKENETKIVYLDILPKGVNKYYSLKFLEKNFEINDLIYSGDSGNDLDVFKSDIKGILVKNASQEIKDEVLKYNCNCYISSGKNNINGNYSSGIIEGLVHYEWIKSSFS